MRELLLGVDLGIKKNTGLAIYDPHKKEYLSIESMDMFDAMEKIKAIHLDPQWDIVVYVENSNLSTNVYGADENLMSYIKKWIGNKIRNYDLLLKKIRSTIAWGQNVGKNKGAAITFCDKLRELDIAIIEINPSDRRVAGSTHKVGQLEVEIPINQLTMPTKCKPHHFQKLTGCMIKCDEHGMDGATMPYGQSFFKSKNWAKSQAINMKNKLEQKKKLAAAKRKAKNKADKNK
jgi:hypothetical protein